MLLVPMAGLIDAAAEAERLTKLLARARSDLEKPAPSSPMTTSCAMHPKPSSPASASVSPSSSRPSDASRANSSACRICPARETYECGCSAGPRCSGPAKRARSPGDHRSRQAAAVRLCLTCLLARGHLLIEDVPGVGKTTLAHALAQVLGLAWQRVQFTSDLLPADIIGVSIFDRPASSSSSARGRSSRSCCSPTR